MQVSEIHNQNIDFTVVIPIHNEKGNLQKILVPWSETPFPIIVIDDGSTDDPNIILDEFQPRIKILKNSIKMGYGYSLKKGIREATTNYILISDGDGQYRPQDAWRLINFMDDYLPEERPDMAVCDRRLKEKPIRFIGRKFLNSLASILAHRWIPDLNSGCRIFRRDLALDYEELFCNTYSFTTTITLMHLIDGYSVEWFPSRVVPREYGTSKVNLIRDGIITLSQILWVGIGLRTRTVRAILRKRRNK